MDLEQLVTVRQCEAASICLNSVDRAGPERARCRLCLYSGHGMMRFWKPERKGQPHPRDAEMRREQRRKKRQDAAERRRQKDAAISLRTRRAVSAEQKVARSAGWKQTVGSGRIFGDGDMKTSFGAVRLLLDHKQQSGSGWTVRAGQLDKVRTEAERLHAIGALVLSSRSGRRVVVLDLDDWMRLERHVGLSSEA